MCSSLEKEKMLALAKCLVEFIDKDNPNTNDYNVLYFLAKQTIKRVESGDDLENIKFTSKEILKGIAPGSDDTNPSNWLNPIFKKIDEKLRVSLEEPLSNFAADKELDSFLWINKSTGGGKSNTSKYWLEPQALVQNTFRHKKKFEPKDSEIKYAAIKNIEATFWAKLLLGKNLSMSGWRKWIFILYPIFAVLLIIMGLYLIYVNWYLSPKPITTRDLSLIIGSIICGWIALGIKNAHDRFVDNGVVIASEWFLKYKEFGVLQELVSLFDDKNQFLRKEVRLVKYIARCSICDETVYLHKGEPEYRNRIIGRCKGNPVEHLFTFDKVTLIGKPLNK